MQLSATQQPTLKLSPPVIVVLLIVAAFVMWKQDTEEDVAPGDPAVAQEGDDSDYQIIITPKGAKAPTSSGEFLKKVGHQIFESPAGLIYRSGSADGHRLDHIMKHASDVPSKPVHGVFNGDREEILALLDEVWTMSQKRGPPAVQKKQERVRTVITVNLNRVIGYTGGESGKRKGYPKCTRIRLVLEGKSVITAYPTL